MAGIAKTRQEGGVKTIFSWAARPVLAAVAVAVLATAWPTGAVAQDALRRMAQRGHIHIAYREDAPPFSFLDAKGQPVGYSIDLCKPVVERIRQELGKPALRIKYTAVPADQLPRVLGSGGVDLACASMSDTPERRKTMGFSPPVFVSSVRFMVRSKDKLDAAQGLRGQTVAVLGRTTAEQAVRSFSDGNGLALKVSRVVSPEAALSQLQLGQVAAFARDKVLLLNQIAQQPQPGDFTVLAQPLSTEYIAIGLPRDAALQRVVDQGLALAVRSGQADALYEQWFVKPHAGAKGGLKLPMSAELQAEFRRLR